MTLGGLETMGERTLGGITHTRDIYRRQLWRYSRGTKMATNFLLRPPNRKRKQGKKWNLII